MQTIKFTRKYVGNEFKMSANKSFNHFVNEIYGENILQLDEKSEYRNIIIGAIDRFYKTGDFSFFSSNLKQRFTRLFLKYNQQPDSLNHIIDKIYNLASDNWQGYYSELVAYDFFSLFTDTIPEINVPASETFAQYFKNRTESSFDGQLPDFSNIKFEVKSFRDINKDILDNLTNKLINEKYFSNIVPNYPNDLDFNRLQLLLPEIRNGLIQSSNKKETSYSHDKLNELRFHLFYVPQRITTSLHSYDAYRHANEHKYFVFNHIDQIFLNQVNLLVYVIHPWFNLVVNDFANSKKSFMRSFSRRIFCELTRDDRELGIVLPHRYPDCKIRISEITKKIGYIMFIIDNNVEPQRAYNSSDLLSVMEGYLFENPNSEIINKGLFIDDIMTDPECLKRFAIVENFEHDNY